MTDRTPRGRFAVGNRYAAVRKAKQATGVSGVSSFSGYLQSDEDHSALTGTRKWDTYQASANTPVVALGIRYFCGLLSGTEWNVVEHEDGGPDARRAADIVRRGLIDAPTPKSWAQVIKKASLYRLFGFSLHATAMRRYSDGMIGYSDIAHRPQRTIERWLRDSETKPFHSVIQRSPETSKLYTIPLDECLYCVDDTLSDSPEGSGLIRHVIEYVRRLGIFEDLEGKAFVEDMGGMPLGRAPLAEMAKDLPGDDDAKRAAILTATQTLRDIMEKRNRTPEEAMWLLLDSDIYRNPDGTPTGIAKWALDIVRTETANLPALDVTVRRVELQIARVLGIEWALMGADGKGSYSMHEDKTSMFATSLQTTINELSRFATHLVRRLVARNGLDPDTCSPRIVAEPISTEAVLVATQALSNLAVAGATLPPDYEGFDVILSRLRLPKLPADSLAMPARQPRRAPMGDDVETEDVSTDEEPIDE